MEMLYDSYYEGKHSSLCGTRKSPKVDVYDRVAKPKGSFVPPFPLMAPLALARPFLLPGPPPPTLQGFYTISRHQY